MTTDQELIRLAFQAREHAYAPYSHYRVGAALLCRDGRVFLGCNIENAAFSPTNCAERTAIFKAISEGARDFDTIAVVGGKQNATTFSYTFPCGVCRQVMLEFCNADQFRILTATDDTDIISRTLAQLMPDRWPGEPVFDSPD